ncbi:MAG: DUF898 family protein, partial [Gammaproteobacteria bacterium]
GLLIALAVPWLLVRSRMFAMHNTSYRNVRFRFPPIYKQAYKVIVGYFLLTIITLGLGYAWAHYHRSKLIVDNTSFGTVRMKLNERIGGSDFFMVYLGAGALLLLAGIGVALVIGVLTPLLGTPEMTGTGENQPLLGVMVSVGAPLLFYVALFLGTAAAILRLILRNTDIGGNQLICNWSLPRLGFIYLTNLIAILLSFGLLIPWATIRIRRYKLAQLQLALGGEDLSTVIAAQTEDVSALGDEIGEAFDYDFGL